MPAGRVFIRLASNGGRKPRQLTESREMVFATPAAGDMFSTLGGGREVAKVGSVERELDAEKGV
jgi:hypothetical protein